MAELETEVNAGEVEEVGGSQDLEAMIDAELAKPAPEGKGAQAGDGKAAATGAGGDKTAGTGEQPPAGEKQASATTEEDKAFLKELGFGDEEAGEVTPKELARLKRVHGNYSGKVRAAEGRAEFFGRANKELSEKYQSQQKTLKEIMAQQTPADRVRGKISKIDVTKLSPGAQKLVQDPEFIEAISIFVDAPAAADKAEDQVPAGGAASAEAFGLTPEVVQDLERDHPDFAQVYGSQEFAAWANAQPKEALLAKLKSGAGHREVLTAFKEDLKKAVAAADEMLTKEIAKVHPDFGKKFSSPGFRAWITTQSRNEQAKLRDTDPKGYIEVLNNFAAHEAAEAVRQRQEHQHDSKNDALRTHGSPAGGIGEGDDFTPNQILTDDKAYQSLKQRIRKNRVRGG